MKRRTSTTTTIRSGWTLDGQRIYIEHDTARRVFKVATRWAWLMKFNAIHDACDAFEALELLEGGISNLATHVVAEIRRVPRHRTVASARGMARVAEIVRCAELRTRGIKPQACGSKSAVVRWVQ